MINDIFITAKDLKYSLNDIQYFIKKGMFSNE